jgi:exopolysaccharide production protein ExoQ
MLEPNRPRWNRFSAGLTAIEEKPVPWLTMILIAVLLFVVGHRLDRTVIQDWSTSFVTSAGSIAEGSPRRRLGYMLLGLWGVVTLVLREPRYRLRLNGVLPWFAVGFACWAALSLFWAADSALAFRRLVLFGIVVSAVIAALRHLSLRDIILFLTLSSFAYALIGIAAELVHETFRPLSGSYRFFGTVGPNRQGMNLAVLVLGAVCLSKMRIERRQLFMIVAIVGFGLLILTRSRTAAGATLVALAAFAGVRSSPLRLTAMLMSAGAVGLFALFLIQNRVLSTPWQVILMGRAEGMNEITTTLSGRTQLWEYLWTFVVERPVLGYGFNSFMSPNRAGDMPALVAWGVGEAHSLYLEILLGTGFVGLSLFLVILVGSIGRAIRWVPRFRDPAFAFLVAYLVFVAVNGLLTAITMYPDPKFVGLLVFGYVLLRDPERELAEEGLVPDPHAGQFAAASGRGRLTQPHGPPGLERRMPPSYFRR